MALFPQSSSTLTISKHSDRHTKPKASQACLLHVHTKRTSVKSTRGLPCRRPLRCLSAQQTTDRLLVQQTLQDLRICSERSLRSGATHVLLRAEPVWEAPGPASRALSGCHYAIRWVTAHSNADTSLTARAKQEAAPGLGAEARRCSLYTKHSVAKPGRGSSDGGMNSQRSQKPPRLQEGRGG